MGRLAHRTLAAAVAAASLAAPPAVARPVAPAAAVSTPAAAPAPAVAVSAPAAVPAYAAGPVDLHRLREELAAATRQAEAAAADVFRAAARNAVLRAEMDRVAEARDAARAALGARARRIYMRGRPDPLAQLFAGTGAPELALARRGFTAGLRSDADLLADVEAASARVAALRRRAEAVRRDLLARAAPVLAAQDRARALLVRAEAAAARDRAALAALRADRDRLDAISTRLTLAVAPAVTARGRRAQAAEEPVVRLLEATGRGMPPGFRPTGRRITGIASWYGPGFVGNPTASGAPYDPERLTAAMLPPVPLGTVVRVTSEDGLAINVLVNDRGPYGKGRVIDLSRAGARWMGFTGLKRVTVELLEPG